MHHHTDLHTVARDAGISDATAYRYLHEGLGVMAALVLTSILRGRW